LLANFEEKITWLERESLIRTLPLWDASYCNFSSNDYLGLSQCKSVIEAGCSAAITYGAGSTGARLLSGNLPLFEKFEAQIAKDKDTEGALLFNSGFQANSGTLEALTDKDSVVLFDKLNHASMYQGVFASRAKLLRFEHLDYSQLEDLLKKNAEKELLIASETVFGMDGDTADMAALSFLSEKYGALLYLDEAHATGLYGAHGYGMSTDFVLDPKATVVMGTFSKALGSSGAYVACSDVIKKYLIQKCRGFIYSTALSPFCIGAAQHAWKLVKGLDTARKDILENASFLRQALRDAGYLVLGAGTNIVPIVFERIDDMVAVKGVLESKKIIVSGIRKPTSPTTRIRIAVSAVHSRGDVSRLLGAVEYARK
jgi:8-amino-7-oxononanoate synthase